MAIADPSGRHRSAASGAVVVSEGSCPVVAVLLAAAKKKPLAPMAAPKGHGPRHRRPFILQTGGFWGCRSGATMVITDPGSWA
jgi:hypothetical protein